MKRDNVPTEWAIRLRVADYGVWQPSDPTAAQSVIGVINDQRRPQDGKPRVEIWGGEKTLAATIDTVSFTLGPGEHLIRLTYPDGSEHWGGMDEDLFARLAARKAVA